MTKYKLIHVDEDTYLRVDDGGIATFHHNGEHMLTEYYQDRCTSEEIDWELLAEGKMYVKDWESKQEVDDEMIQDALNWLVMYEDNFERTNELKFVELPF